MMPAQRDPANSSVEAVPEFPSALVDWLAGWLLDAAYLVALLVLSPLLAVRALTLGKYRSGFHQKWRGDLPLRTSSTPVVWLHAVSVGEVLQLEPVIHQIRAVCPGVHLVISTTTDTGHELAVRKYPDCQVVYYPLDFTWAVHRALARVRPDLIVLVELELWPNFLRAARNRNVPVALINGRLSERSFRGYQWIRPVVGSMLRSLSVIAVQDASYAARIEALRGPPVAGQPALPPVHVTGSIKFDRVRTDRNHPLTEELRSAFRLTPGQRLFLAGSTQDPEERLAIETWLTLRIRHPDLRLMLVPRHRERFEAVAQLVERQFGLPLLRRSQPESGTGKESPVLLLDTLGELSAAWGLAEIAFVGGSLTRRGGQNMLEPAGYGAAVLFGPNTRNFRDIVTLLCEADAVRIVKSGDELTATVEGLLQDPQLAEELGSRAQALVQQHRGATERTVHLLRPWLPASAQLPRAA